MEAITHQWWTGHLAYRANVRWATIQVGLWATGQKKKKKKEKESCCFFWPSGPQACIAAPIILATVLE